MVLYFPSDVKSFKEGLKKLGDLHKQPNTKVQMLIASILLYSFKLERLFPGHNKTGRLWH